MNWINKKIEEFKGQTFSDNGSVVGYFKQALQDCQNQTRQEIVEMIEKERVISPHPITINKYLAGADYGWNALADEIINKIKNLK